MNKRFDTLFALDNNLYAEGSPVVVSAGVLLKDSESNRLVAQIKFRNVTSKIIWALTISLACVDTAGQPTSEVFTYQYQDLTATRSEEFGSNKAILIPDSNTRSYTITEVTAVFSDGTTQTTSARFSPLPEQKLLSLALDDLQLVKQYRLATNDSAMFTPHSDRGLQLCPCGQWHTQPYCASCGLSYEQAEQAYHLPTLSADMRIRLEQEAADREEQRRSDAYNKAKEEISSGKLHKLRKAESALNELGEYRDSAELLLQCRNAIKDIALSKMQNPKSPSDYAKAETIFLSLGELEDCAALAKQCHAKYINSKDCQTKKVKTLVKRGIIAAAIIALVLVMIPITRDHIIPSVKYSQAEKLAEAAQYDDAIEAFEALGDYKDAPDRVDAVTYAKACALMENGNFTDAANIFSALGKYSDSADQLKECRYRNAKELMAQGKYEDAIIQLKKTANHADTVDLLNQCYLAMAEQNYSTQRYTNALAWYTKITDLDTTNANYIDCVYQSALEKLNSGDYKNAVQLFSQIYEYSDSAEKRNEAMYGYIIENKNNQDATTLEYLNELKEAGYKDTKSIFDSLYTWSFTVTANTTQINTKNSTSISRYSKVYFHIIANGGQPNESIDLYAKVKTPNGRTIDFKLEDMKNTEHRTAACGAPYLNGTASISVYNAETNAVVATHNVKIN